MDKLKMASVDIVSENVKKIAEIFPNCVTESSEGKAIDFELLKQELSKDLIEANKERYRIEWPGKKQAINLANKITNKTLRPIKIDSVNFDTTENIYIEGDNLEVLKLMQESYLSKVKMIYIDPPYNTGKDFIYNDNFDKDKLDELIESGQLNELSQRLTVNQETSGRYHSDWLSMMYSRLKLARNLLTTDGAIFISIDDNEISNLKKICDEIFGENNFINSITVKMSEMKGAKLAHIDKRFPKIKEYLLIYCKNKDDFSLNPVKIEKNESDLKGYVKYYAKQISNLEDSCEKWKFESVSMDYETKIQNAKSLIYLVTPDADKNVEAPINTFTFLENTSGKKEYFYNDDGVIKKVLFLYDNLTTYQGDLWTNISTININKENYDIPTYSNGQKPLELLMTIYKSFLSGNDLVLDFFSGSATSADALLRYNESTSSNNKFIMVQIPEEIKVLPGMDNETKKSIEKMIVFLTNIKKPLFLTEIGKERIRRSIESLKNSLNLDKEVGFRCFYLDESNMNNVYYRPQDYDQSKIDMFANNVKADRSGEDLLIQIMLDWGLQLNHKIMLKTISGKNVYSVNGDSLYACFDERLDENFARELAKEKPLRIVFRDSSFKDNNSKINVKQLLKQLSPETEMKVI
jgi:adenine-specific DNA-methyltransferase